MRLPMVENVWNINRPGMPSISDLIVKFINKGSLIKFSLMKMLTLNHSSTHTETICLTFTTFPKESCCVSHPSFTLISEIFVVRIICRWEICKIFQNKFLFKNCVWIYRRINFCKRNSKMQLSNTKLQRKFIW